MNHIINELQLIMDVKVNNTMDMAMGQSGAFPFVVYFDSNVAKLVFSVKKDAFPNVFELKALTKRGKTIRKVSARGYRVEFIVKTAFSGKKSAKNIVAAVEEVAAFFAANNYISCCERTGENVATKGYVVGGVVQILSEKGFLEASSNLAMEEQKSSLKRENVIGGTVGALLGSLLGVAAIVAIAQLGYVAAISGTIMGVVTVKGYSLLGGKLSKKGIVISALVIIAMVYIGNNIDWAIQIAREFDVDFISAFSAVGEIASHPDIRTSYYANLGMLYLFTAVGAIPTMIKLVKESQEKHRSYMI